MIRYLKNTDLESIMTIWLNENLNVHHFINKNYWINNFHFVKNELPKADVYIYEEDNIIKGFIGVVDSSYIAGLFVDKNFQGCGIGSSLLQKCFDTYENLSLNVYVKNYKALEFYKKHGFKIAKEVIDSITNETEYFMTWKKELSH